ncbi:MAG: GNAT family N-acetyltransferase [Gammaproteobacteria bacterium]|nr:GNAT family N-acetyltransferase [Gammaproteobacteria bacterium]
MNEITVREACWPEDEPAIHHIREVVFVIEQRVEAELEWDGEDAHCRHVLARDAAGTPVGTGRLSATGKIGRMAVLKAYRGRGVGRQILQALLRLARDAGQREVYLHAQTRALDFYAAAGFRAEGEEFEEADIPHRRMRLPLQPESKGSR